MTCLFCHMLAYITISFHMFRYLFEAAVGLPLLFSTLPNQFGRQRQINNLGCHVLAFVLLGRAFQARYYLDAGLFRLFDGPWDVPAVFRGNDCFAMVARSVGFFLHLLQAGFFVKFALYYIPAFFSCSGFQMQRVGCRTFLESGLCEVSVLTFQYFVCTIIDHSDF